MKPSLQLRQSQHLALTPQLQQSIRLLQLSTLELNQEIEQILSQNPLLERLDDPLEAHERLAGDGSLRVGVEKMPDAGLAAGTSEGPQAGEREAAYDGGDDRAGDRAASETREDGSPERGEVDSQLWGSEGSGRGGSDDGDDDRAPEHASSTEVSLREHLCGQLAGVRCTSRDHVLVMLLIEELDDDGYLRTSLEEIAESLPAEADIDPDELVTALSLLQSFEPAGIAARSASECLQLQLPLAAERAGAAPAVTALAVQIVRDHLDLLAGREFSKLRKLLRCEEDALRDAQKLIQRLDPRPGSRFSSVSAAYVVPDVVVRRTRQGWRAMLNPDVVPRLRVNALYAQILKSHRPAAGAGTARAAPTATAGPRAAAGGPDNGAAASNSLSSQLQEARWLVKNVQQRFDTILRVSQEIVDRQKAYFSHGAVAMRPLVLREVADAVGLHESTISRVTTQKYMLTPFGTVELKYFFGSHVATESGGAASSTAIRALIRQLIEQEDATQPLSDSRIAELLGEQGIVVARRTVAKYREALRIAPVAQRKAL